MMLRVSLASFAAIIVASFSQHAAADDRTGARPDPSASKEAPPATPARRAGGVNFEVHLGAKAPFGELVKGLAFQDLTSMGYDLDLRLGVYPTRHLGVVIGGAVSAYSMTGCDRDDCGIVGYRVPVAVEVVFQDRARGPFANFAVHPVAGHVVAVRELETTSYARATYTSNLRSVEIVFGWRVHAAGPWSFVPRLSITLGEHDHLAAPGYDGAIPSELRALGYGVGLSCGLQLGS